MEVFYSIPSRNIPKDSLVRIAPSPRFFLFDALAFFLHNILKPKSNIQYISIRAFTVGIEQPGHDGGCSFDVFGDLVCFLIPAKTPHTHSRPSGSMMTICCKQDG